MRYTKNWFCVGLVMTYCSETVRWTQRKLQTKQSILHDQLSDSFAGHLETELHSNKTATSMALQVQCPESISQTVPLFQTSTLLKIFCRVTVPGAAIPDYEGKNVYSIRAWSEHWSTSREHRDRCMYAVETGTNEAWRTNCSCLNIQAYILLLLQALRSHCKTQCSERAGKRKSHF